MGAFFRVRAKLVSERREAQLQRATEKAGSKLLTDDKNRIKGAAEEQAGVQP
jgi:hypothetical protein